MCRIPDDFIDERATLTWSASCTGKACISRYLTDAIHTATPSSRFFFHVMASLTERERELTGEYPHRAGSRPPAGPQGRAQAKNDRQQDRISQEAAGQRRAAARRGQEPGRVRANSVPLDSGILAGLTYAVIRFLKWPLCQQKIRRHGTNRHVADGVSRTPETGGRLVSVVLMAHGDSQSGGCVTWSAWQAGGPSSFASWTASFPCAFPSSDDARPCWRTCPFHLACHPCPACLRPSAASSPCRPA